MHQLRSRKWFVEGAACKNTKHFIYGFYLIRSMVSFLRCFHPDVLQIWLIPLSFSNRSVRFRRDSVSEVHIIPAVETTLPFAEQMAREREEEIQDAAHIQAAMEAYVVLCYTSFIHICTHKRQSGR